MFPRQYISMLYALGACAAILLANLALHAQPSSGLKLLKVDPPNWWAGMPKPMLLVRGEGLADADFSLSDNAIQVEKKIISQNGHWAQLWLSASPASPETITVRASRGESAASLTYKFAARKSPAEGFAGFSSLDVLYLIMTDRFADGDTSNDGPNANSNSTSAEAFAERAKPRGWHGGDLRGIAQHLDYLQRLGVTAVWTTPVYQNKNEPESYHGYGATDLYAVDEHYGSLEDLKALSAALHASGMKLVLDTVPNHVGPAHPWVTDEPAPDWFHGDLQHHLVAESKFDALINPHAPQRDRVGTLDGWFADALPDMNTENPAVAQYLRQNAIWWIEQTGADALRIDTFPYVNRQFWHNFNGELAELYPHMTEVGEIFNPDPVIVSSFAGGVTRAGIDTELTTPFDFPTYFAIRDVFGKNAPLSRLAQVLASDSLYPHPERLVPFFGNHDTNRFTDAVKSPDALRLAFAYIITTRGMPQIYSGDEIAMHGGGDPDNRHDFPGGFAPVAGAPVGNAFAAEGRSAEQQQNYAWVAQLTSLRHAHAALGCGGEQVLASDADWLVYVRDARYSPAARCGDGRDRVLVAIHRGAEPASLSVPMDETWAANCLVSVPEIAAAGSTVQATDGKLLLHLQEEDALIAACK
jgi:glycosidase